MNYWEQSDKMLVDLTLLGKEQAYEELVIRWQGRVIGAAAAILRDDYLAEDAAQDAFVSAWVKLNCLRDGEKFGAWVCRIARNRAKNMILRNSEMLSLDETILSVTEAEENFDEFFSPSMDYSRLYQGISRLSEKVRTVIQLHYLQGLSLAEISDRLRIPIGTVKYRLFDGREKLRKDMGISMKNEINETFVEKVMKKVEEIKRWQLKNDKKGFETFYREVLADLELLPDSEEKHHAVADVQMRGCWWIPGEKNDELLARIRENAEKGRNDNVFCSVLTFEREAFSGQELVDYMLEKQIPEAREKGFPLAEAHTRFWLGYEYCRNLNQQQKGMEAFENVLELITPEDVYYANAISALRIERLIAQAEEANTAFNAIAEEYRVIDGKLRFWSQPGYSRGCYKIGEPSLPSYVFWHAAQCDHLFYDPDMKLGETYLGSDGVSTLTFSEDRVTAQTACGEFHDCQVWEVHMPRNIRYRTYYKYNIGIVRQECNYNGYECIYTLKSYHIAGGTGLLPLHTGNRWEYTPSHLDSNCYHSENVHEILFSDGSKTVAAVHSYIQRTGINLDNWQDVMLEMRNSYCKKDPEGDGELLLDVSHLMKRANELASTPYEKFYTEIACKVMERIMRTDEVFNPALTEKGHWNFFGYYNVYRENGRLSLNARSNRSFEWKDMKDTGLDGYPLLHNHIYTILEDAFESYLWDETFTVGTEKIIEQTDWKGNKIVTTLSVKDAGTITTPAGTFENCILLDLHIKGRTGGWKYRGGKKEYYLAPGIGIVKAVNYYKERTRVSPYELTAYQGVGEGYFPMEPGMFRRYENRTLQNGFAASSEYYCTQDDAGNTVLMSNLLGVRRLNSTENIEESTKC